MTKQRAVLAVPGDLNTVTGGYIYDRRVLDALRTLGLDMTHIALPGSFPAPSPADMTTAFDQLNAVADHGPVIIDGLAFGALDPIRVAQIRAPIVALIHHPLALESGLSLDRQKQLFETERANLRHATHIIVPSPHTASVLVSDYDVARGRITIARPGTDQPTGTAAPIDPPLIMSVGIQLPRKGHDVLIKALACIRDLDWQAVIVGAPLDRDHAQMLDHLRTTLELSDRVTLAGQISDKKLATLYQSAAIFALATRFEGYGIVFDEALVHGLPVISCATGAVPDTVPADAGRLVPPDQPSAFGDALRAVLTEPDTTRSLAAAARTAGQALPGWTDTALRIADTLSQIKQT